MQKATGDKISSLRRPGDKIIEQQEVNINP